MISIFIPAAPKDRNKLKFLISSIEKNIEEFDEIIISVPDKSKFEGYIPQSNGKYNIVVYEDKEILNIDYSLFKYRGHWIYQQFLKMFQDVTKNDLYLTVDADVIFNKPLPMFQSDGKKILWMGWEQNNRPYFEFQEKVFDLPRLYPHTFINDCNFFSKKIFGEILQSKNYTQDSFILKSIDVIDNNCYPAEPEIFGQYVYKFYQHEYSFRQAKTFSTAKWANDFDDMIWTDAEITEEIERVKQTDYDMFTLHSWYLKK